VFQQLADDIEAENNLNQQHWIEKFEAFKLGNNVNRLLYFGTAQPRRGYAELLKLAIDLNYSFVHCGKRDENEDYGVNVQKLRNELKSKNLLFETNEFLTDKNTIDYFFKSVTHLVLPYINFLSSSGVMIQALAAGIPVLAPETGLMAYRIDRYKLGRTYKPGKLREATERFFNENPADYQESISRYMKYQSSGLLEHILTDIITAEHKSQILPA
jgi:glycosyltransferase involved in cell wall biosynthesis